MWKSVRMFWNTISSNTSYQHTVKPNILSTQIHQKELWSKQEEEKKKQHAHNIWRRGGHGGASWHHAHANELQFANPTAVSLPHNLWTFVNYVTTSVCTCACCWLLELAKNVIEVCSLTSLQCTSTPSYTWSLATLGMPQQVVTFRQKSQVKTHRWKTQIICQTKFTANCHFANWCVA